MTLTLVLKKAFYPKEYNINYVKYESSITYHSKAMADVKVFADKQMDKWKDGQMDGPKTICSRSIDAGA